jgi:small-conductance mechanosensitive channel
MTSKALLILLLFLTFVLSACQDASVDVGEIVDESVVATRQALPQPTPGVVEQGIIAAAQSTRLSGGAFLGLTIEEWINLAISLLIVLFGYLIGVWLLGRFENWLVRKLGLEAVPATKDLNGAPIRWLIFILALRVATLRLTFLSPPMRRALLDIFYVAIVVLLAIVLWRAIALTYRIIKERNERRDRSDLDPALVLMTRLARILLAIVFMVLVLSYFGINVAALSAAVGLGGLAISLAARDTIADAIAGVIILLDRPFRIGDRIEIERANTWGDVTEIGLRTTRIRTRDNRLVIVPNSMIASNQIINYTYPDPRYRIQTRVGIAYRTDIEWARRIMIETVDGVDGVLSEMGVDALFEEMGESAMIFVVRWWIDSFADFRRVLDRVNTALQNALDQNGVVCPYPTSTVILRSEAPAAPADSTDASQAD